MHRVQYSNVGDKSKSYSITILIIQRVGNVSDDNVRAQQTKEGGREGFFPFGW